MPCSSRNREAAAQRKRQEQLDALVSRLKGGTARLERRGSVVSIEGWDERAGWCDSCAVAALRQHSDAHVRMLVARAAPAGAALTFGHGH